MKSLFTILLVLTSFILNAQNEFIVEYNLEDFTFQKVSKKIDDVSFIFPGMNTYDQNSSIFYFISSQEKEGVYGINVVSGELESFFESQNIQAIEFSNSLNELYAIKIDITNNIKQLVQLDVDSGTVLSVSDTIPASTMFQGQDAFNDKLQQYTFTGPPNILYTLDTQSGTILHQPTLSFPQGINIQHYEYDTQSGNLYALFSEDSGNSVFLAKIDVTTGVYDKIGESKTNLYIGGSATIDEANKLYLYIYRQSQSYYLAALSLIDGEIIFNQPVSIEDTDNLIDLEFDNVTGKLYSKHWDSLTSSNDELSSLETSLYPNPTNGVLFLYSSELQIQKFEIFDFSGNLVHSDNLVGGQILLPMLPNGNYIFKWKDKSKKVGHLKFSVVK